MLAGPPTAWLQVVHGKLATTTTTDPKKGQGLILMTECWHHPVQLWEVLRNYCDLCVQNMLVSQDIWFIAERLGECSGIAQVFGWNPRWYLWNGSIIWGSPMFLTCVHRCPPGRFCYSTSGRSVAPARTEWGGQHEIDDTCTLGAEMFRLLVWKHGKQQLGLEGSKKSVQIRWTLKTCFRFWKQQGQTP